MEEKGNEDDADADAGSSAAAVPPLLHQAPNAHPFT